jgi:putative ABC transport system permease protein
VVALISLSQGLKAAISQQFVNIGSDKLIVQAAGGGFGPPGTAVPKPLTKVEKKAIEGVKGVDIVVGRLIRIVQMKFKDDVKYGYAVTIPDNPEEKALVIEVNNYKLAQGKFFDKKNARQVIVGGHIPEDFFDKEVKLRDKIFIQGEEFKVVGILKSSGNPQQDHTFVLPEQAMRDVLAIPKEFDIIPLKVEEADTVNQVETRIAKELRKVRAVEEGKEDFTIETPQQIIATLNNILLIVQGVLVGIAAISLFVGGIGIMNTMYTAVSERTREIGIMKAVGAKNGEIQLLFLIESGFLGTFGGIIGVSLGVGIGKLVEWVAVRELGSQLIQAEFAPALLLGSLLFAFFVGGISGFFPARQASRLKPVEALRK